MSEEQPPNFRVLKIVVVVLGIAILGMTGIIVVKGIEKFGGGDVNPATSQPATAPAATAPAAMPATIDGQAWTVSLPQGSEIRDTKLDGHILTVRALSHDGGTFIRLIDVRNGALIGQVIQNQ